MNNPTLSRLNDDACMGGMHDAGAPGVSFKKTPKRCALTAHGVTVALGVTPPPHELRMSYASHDTLSSPPSSATHRPETNFNIISFCQQSAKRQGLAH